MTKQITIKLNEAKFKPILDWLDAYGRNTFTSYSDITAKCLYYIYLVMNEKREDLDGMTRIEFIDKKRNVSLDEGFIGFLKSYNDFSKKGELPKGCKKPEV